MSTSTSVSILIPAFNEAPYIRNAILSLIPGEREQLSYEIIVLDGGSTDGTQDIVRGMMAGNKNIRVEFNEKRLQAAAINKGVRLARSDSEVIIRADSHAKYPADFAARLVEELDRSKADSVVVPMQTVGLGFTQRGIAAAQNSRLGNGGAAHRSTSASRYVEHGHHAAFRRAAFLSVNGYDESFACNEDAELDVRLIRSGAKIWHSATTPITYFPRKTISSLARQYFNHGAGRAKTLLKHRQIPAVRQILPVIALGTNVTSLVLGAAVTPLLLLPAASYMTVCCVWGAALAIRDRDVANLASGPAGIAMHHAWAAGFLHTLAKRVIQTLKATAATGTTPPAAAQAAVRTSPATASPPHHE